MSECMSDHELNALWSRFSETKSSHGDREQSVTQSDGLRT